MRGDFDEDEDDDMDVISPSEARHDKHMAEQKTPSRYEDCIRWHSRTCTCGITEAQSLAYAAAEAVDGDPDCTTGQPLISQEVLDGLTVAGARAFWALKDLEKQHESLRADVMTIASDPHLSWDEARTMLLAALNTR